MEDKKAQIKQSKFLGIFLMLVFCVVFVMGATIFYPVSEPTGNTEDSSFIAEYNFTEANLKSVKWAFNGTNTTIFDDSVVLMMNFDNRSSLGENDTHVVDISGNGNNGTVTGATFNSTGGKYNGAFEFDGDGDWINVDELDNFFNNESNSSYCLWFNKKDSNINLIQEAGSGGGFNLKVTSNNKLRIDQASDFTTVAASTDLSDDIWYHTCITYNSSNWKIYLNGEEESITDGASPFINCTSCNFLISTGYNPEVWNGTIDEVNIWNKSLSSTEVSILYNSQLTKYNSENYSFYKNQSMITNTTGISYEYYLCSIDSSDDENCTSVKTITRLPKRETINSNFTSLVGDINNDFYGTNDQYFAFSDTGIRKLDSNCDGSEETLMNTTYNKQLLEESGMSHMRIWISDINGVNTAEGAYNTVWINAFMREAEYINSINGTITFVGYGIPTWLANTTTGWCNETSSVYSGDWASCTPTNATKYAEVLGYIINNISQVIPQDKINLIPQNEPYGNFFLNNLSYDNQIKADEVIKIYNATYDYIKENYPNVSVGGPSFNKNSSSPNMRNTFLSNMTTKMDFVDFHPYDGESYISTNAIKAELDYLFDDCETYGANCSRVILDEYDLTNQYTLEDDLYSAEMAFSFQSVLNSYPSNVSMLKFKWGSVHSYDTCSARYSQYPIRFAMFDEEDDFISPAYNVTKNFATYHSAGSTVYTSTSSSSAVKTVSSQKDNEYFITVINTDTEARNITVNTDGTLTKIYNMETGEEFTSDTGIFTVGVMDSYEILYLGYEGIESGLVCQMDLNENSGTIAYDNSGNSNNGLITGAVWFTDGILVTLTSTVDYTIDTTTGLFTLTNLDYLYSWLEIDWTYRSNVAESGCDQIFSGFDTAFSLFAIAIISFIGLVGTFFGIRFLLVYVKPIINKDGSNLAIVD